MPFCTTSRKSRLDSAHFDEQPPPREGGLRRRRQKAVAEFEFVKAQLTGEKPNLGENRKTNVDMR